MPLLETVGSGSARSFGLNAGGDFFYSSLQLITGYGGVSSPYGVWTANSYNPINSTLYDVSGNLNHSDEVNNPSQITKSTNYSGGSGTNSTFTTLSAPAADLMAAASNAAVVPGIKLKNAFVASDNYTLFVVMRIYNGTTNRFIDGTNNNWLAGSWGGSTGVFYQEGWLSSQNQQLHGNNWFLVTVKHGLGRTNSVQRTSNSPGVLNSINRASLMYGQHSGEASNWAFAEAVYYNRSLNSTEFTNVENALKSKYGLNY